MLVYGVGLAGLLNRGKVSIKVRLLTESMTSVSHQGLIPSLLTHVAISPSSLHML